MIDPEANGSTDPALRALEVEFLCPGSSCGREGEVLSIDCDDKPLLALLIGGISFARISGAMELAGLP